MPRKLKQENENRIKEVNNEKPVKEPKEKKVKELILKMYLDPFLVKNDKMSKLITKEFGLESTNLNNQTLEFFYSEKFETNTYKVSTDAEIKIIYKYFLNLRKKMRDALGIPKIIKGFLHYIQVLDNCTDESKIISLPRYKKMKRLDELYDRCISFGLTLIHSYFWCDFLNKDIMFRQNELTLDECIQKATPYIFNLKKHFEDLVGDEFTYDADEEKLFLN